MEPKGASVGFEFEAIWEQRYINKITSEIDAKIYAEKIMTFYAKRYEQVFQNLWNIFEKSLDIL